jgi:thiol-disulfide isomerase/thioredoxin
MNRVVLALLVLTGCGTPTRPPKIEWVHPADGAVAQLVEKEVRRATPDGRRVLVYVGATWCEPCRRFHEAVQRGALDAQFGNLRLVEFDLDKDGDRLRDAGYTPKLIPLLALPAKDGFATGKQMEGSVKGDGAVDQMVPRLSALLQKS